MYGILAAGYGDWPVIKQIAWLFGKIMNAIFDFMNYFFGIQNIGICIIIFTIVTYTLLLPITIKQQKSMKLSVVTTPELNKIRKKYEGKKDQTSMMKMQEEVQAVHDKYGTSTTGGCLPLLIQMPFLFALYPVIQNIPNYVTSIKNVYMPVVDKIMATNGFQSIMETIGREAPVHMNPASYDYTNADTLVNVLYKFQDSTWKTLLEKIPSLQDVVETTTQTVGHMNSFLGINIGETPMTMLTASIRTFSIVGIILAVIIPVLSGLTQFINMKMQPQASTDANDQMANSMKTMNYTMPLVSVFIGFTLPAGLGLYWAVSAVVRSIQLVFINKYLSKKSLDDMIEEAKAKAEKKKKRRKNYVSAEEVNKMASVNTKKVQKKSLITEEERKKKLDQAASYAKNAKKGSLTSKANMVNRYNNSNKKED